MADHGSMIMHIIEILGVFVCAHHLWPKGVTYGGKEDWEKAYRKKHGHASRSKSKRPRNEAMDRSRSQGRSRSDGPRRRDRSERGEGGHRNDDATYHDDRYYEDKRQGYYYDERPVYAEQPAYSRRASSRY